uniref:Uncharacterized protein n=2 Tax=unclassified Candidatus Kentrum TaxID=2643149 RepID=A0A450WK56_9GAMM|nr:MAG: hypothetical protein BECKLPF1236A_GA0070988_101707 [Candidatus Kentron sp. LPFa]VFK69085.1 MAG: hypothetical protein BECKUNK1418G_GA0071005_13104 [Candidatus Kentron sp. UNK]
MSDSAHFGIVALSLSSTLPASGEAPDHRLFELGKPRLGSLETMLPRVQFFPQAAET